MTPRKVTACNRAQGAQENGAVRAAPMAFIYNKFLEEDVAWWRVITEATCYLLSQSFDVSSPHMDI